MPTLPAIDIVPPIEEFNPKKHFDKPALWKYYPDTSHKIWIPKNHQAYIMPDNELVKYFADNIEFIENNHVSGHPQVTQRFLRIIFKGTDNSPIFKYRVDDARLYEESGQKAGKYWADFWMNPDFYVWNELEGDCEDYVLLISSVFERMKIPYMAVNGFVQTGIRHVWLEFVYKNEIWMADVAIHNGVSAKPKNEMLITSVNYVPYKMFNKATPAKEYEEWHL